MVGQTDAVVLVVDDDPQVVGLYADLLGETYAVLTATDGEQALEKLDDRVDVVLLDRRMPSLSGDEVLATIRDEGFNCRVALVSAVQPEIDVVDLGFDEYLVKPVSRSELEDVVERLLERVTYEDDIQRLLGLLTKRAVLEAELSDAALADEAAYGTLLADIEALRTEVDAAHGERSAEAYESLFRDLERGPRDPT